MLIRYGYEITISCSQPTEMICLLDIHDENDGRVRRKAEVVTTPSVPTRIYRDLFGNICRRFRAPAGAMSISSDGLIEDDGALDAFEPDAPETPVGDLPDDCLVYLMGSRYCETDKMSQTAWDLFGQTPPGWGRVQAICDFVNRQINFDYMQASSTRSSVETFHGRFGVCRDFAHLAITFCRCLNIPARYVNGHLGDIGVPLAEPMDFSAWIEVYLGGRWYTFDPRNNARRIGRIVVARGRDAADIPLMNSFGPHLLTGFKVWTHDVNNVPPSALTLPPLESA